MKLYLLYRCPFGHRASIVLQEKKLAFEPVFFEVGKRPPEMAAVGPYAKSPTLIDGDAKIWDSQIVIEYLEDRYPTPSLMPTDPAQRAEVRMLNARIAHEIGSRAGVIAVEMHYKPQRDQAKIDEGLRGFLHALEAWDQQLEGRTFLVGDALSLADVTLYTLFPAVMRDTGVEIPAERKHLRAWFERMSSRPTTKLLEPS